MLLTVTFIRHGESEDNKKDVWGGWKDSPLSDLGQKQVRAVGQFFSRTKLDYIYASPLLRAYATGKAIFDAQPEPRPSFEAHLKLREQHFGIAEGHPWVWDLPPHTSLQDSFDKGIFPVLRRHERFPGGESHDELALRADEAISECILPHLLEKPGNAGGDIHIAIASHGLCISELVAGLIRLDPAPREYRSYVGLLNTAWTRVTVSMKGNQETNVINSGTLPPLTVNVTDVNRADHLDSVLTFADSSKEANQNSEARAFFGGRRTGLTSDVVEPVDGEGGNVL